MTEGRVLAIFIVRLLVLVGIIDNASISHDDERRHHSGSNHPRGR
jgi:hypothetical protein